MSARKVVNKVMNAIRNRPEIRRAEKKIPSLSYITHHHSEVNARRKVFHKQLAKELRKTRSTEAGRASLRKSVRNAADY